MRDQKVRQRKKGCKFNRSLLPFGIFEFRCIRVGPEEGTGGTLIHVRPRGWFCLVYQAGFSINQNYWIEESIYRARVYGCREKKIIKKKYIYEIRNTVPVNQYIINYESKSYLNRIVNTKYLTNTYIHRLARTKKRCIACLHAYTYSQARECKHG
ncbi:hypothetical protein AA313_de0204644 [Arthrobotrys entomopaga]|nr:hypothetical protein AA313_de0204644 [Arthrobotrys entomopaga]